MKILDLVIYLEGDNATRLSMPVTSDVLDDRYAVKNGLPGGQSITGGVASGENLTLASSSHATKGSVILGSASGVVFDGVNNNLTITNTGLHLLDTNASHDLIISPGSDLTGDTTLTITTGSTARTLNISGNLTKMK